MNVRVHRIASYERHCSNKHPLALKGLRNRYLHISMLLLTRARVILGQVRNRSKHNSPIKKKRNAFARRPNFPKRRSTIPGDDRRRLRGSRFEEGRLLFLISGNPIRNEGQVTKRGNSSNRCPTFARGFPCINNERLSRRAGLQALSIFRRERARCNFF